MASYPHRIGEARYDGHRFSLEPEFFERVVDRTHKGALARRDDMFAGRIALGGYRGGQQRMLTRTTRSVAPTDAGERLLATLRPSLEQIEEELASVGALREKPAGNVRITASQHAVETILWPVLARLLPEHPDVHVELSVDSGFTDIVAQRFDAGVRLGEALAKNLVAVRIGPDLRMAVVGSPSYFARRPPPTAPQDLSAHRCINLRLMSGGGLYAWELEKDGREVRVRVDGQLAFDNINLSTRAAESGPRPRLRHGEPSGGADRRGTPCPGARRLVSIVPGLPPLLSQSPPTLGRVHIAGRGAQTPAVLKPPHHLRPSPSAVT